MIDQPAFYCPRCAAPLPSDGPGRCGRCGGSHDAPREHTIEALLALPRRPCQSCYRSMPDFASVCERCLVIQDPARPAPALLPRLHQANLDVRSYEDNVIYVVLPGDAPTPEAEGVIAALSGSRLHIHDVAEAEYNRGHKPLWERQLFAEHPDRPRHSWETSAAGVRPRRGERVHIWLEETGLPQDMGLDAADPDTAAFIQSSRFTLGLHCESSGAPPWNTLMLMRLVGCIASGAKVIEAATGRVLPEVWREAAEVRPPAMRECYAVVVEQRDGVAWVRTRGLPRWGCFELEILDCAVERIAEATHLIHAVAAALLPADELPPPWRPLFFKNGAAFAWVPFEQVADRIAPERPGATREERRRLRHVTVVLVSPYFGPNTYAHIASLPEPPSGKASPSEEAPVAAAPASTPPPLPASDHPRALAAFISFVLPGSAQIWLGQRTKGTTMLVLGLLTCGGFGLLSIASAVDAWRLTGRLAAGERPGEWDWF